MTSTPRPRVTGAAFPSFYVEAFDEAVAFWTTVLGPAEYEEPEGDGRIVGFRVGDTWLTLLPAAAGPHPDSGPRNCEFALRVATPADVDALFALLVTAGAKARMVPRDTRMYDTMRFACADTPHGIRVDVFCPAG